MEIVAIVRHCYVPAYFSAFSVKHAYGMLLSLSFPQSLSPRLSRSPYYCVKVAAVVRFAMLMNAAIPAGRAPPSSFFHMRL